MGVSGVGKAGVCGTVGISALGVGKTRVSRNVGATDVGMTV